MKTREVERELRQLLSDASLDDRQLRGGRRGDLLDSIRR
jgi:hypothetical protein